MGVERALAWGAALDRSKCSCNVGHPNMKILGLSKWLGWWKETIILLIIETGLVLVQRYMQRSTLGVEGG